MTGISNYAAIFQNGEKPDAANRRISIINESDRAQESELEVSDSPIPPTAYAVGYALMPLKTYGFSSHHQSAGSFFSVGQISFSVSPSKSSPFFIT
jgi:hypothetical protein